MARAGLRFPRAHAAPLRGKRGVRMQVLDVWGAQGLHGTVRVPGAKNSVLPLLAASLLCTQAVTLENVPGLTDVACAVRILRELGCGVRGPYKGVLDVLPASEPGSTVPPEDMRAMRSSLFFLAPMLVRAGRACVGLPGGCKLGARPIDMHLKGLAQMGAQVEESGASLFLRAPRGLQGADITLRFPSVGASETLLMAAVCAKGMTVLRGAATEPEVQDLARFLCSAGASIEGIGTRTLRIMGTPQLGGARHIVCADRIVAATALCAVAACGGDVCLTGENGAHLAALLHILRRMGCEVCRTPGGLMMARQGRLCAPGALYTDVYPALATDAAPLLAAVFLKSEGFSAVTDTVFENRFACAEGFAAMGGNVRVSGRTLLAKGRRRLHAADVAAPDLRGGAALCIAALCADGKSTIREAQHIARGYEDMAALIRTLGARAQWREDELRQAVNA